MRIDNTNTVGTKINAILSTVRCTGALELCASRTILMIPASTVSSPTCSARKRKVPDFTKVPAKTLSPVCLLTGSGSPEIMLSSTPASLAVTHPSTGIFSPALTSTMSPLPRVATGTSHSSICFVSAEYCSMRAVLGARPISVRIAEAVLFFARSSSRRPVSTKEIIITDAS